MRNLRSLTLLLLSISLIAANTLAESLEVTHHTAVLLRLLLSDISEETDRAIFLGLLSGTESIADESEVHGLEEGVRVNVGSVTALSASNVLLGGRSVIIGNGVVVAVVLFLLSSVSHGVINLSGNGDVLLTVVGFHFKITFNRCFSNHHHRFFVHKRGFHDAGFLNGHTVIHGGNGDISSN